MDTEIVDEQENLTEPKKKSLLDTLISGYEGKREKGKRINKKRYELSLKIFEHVKEKNRKYLENSDYFKPDDDIVEFEQFEKSLTKVEQSEQDYNPRTTHFDHLELFRPLLPKNTDQKPISVPKETTQARFYRKVGPNEHENWKKHIIMSAQDLTSDYRSDIYTIRAGWVPACNQRTWSQFLSAGMQGQDVSCIQAVNYRHMANSLSLLNTGDPDHLNIDPSSWFSLFPCEDRYINSNKWMNDCIVPADAELNNVESSYVMDPLAVIDLCAEKEIEKNERIHVKNNINKLKMFRYDKNNELEFLNHTKLFFTSADEYYWPPKRTEIIEDAIYSITIKHSLPALDLQRTFFPTYQDVLHLRRWHRPLLSDFQHGNKMKVGAHKIQNMKNFSEESLRAYKEIIETNKSSDVFLMKSMKDLSSLNGHLVLLEYSEQFPLFLSQIGMNSLIRTYYTKLQKNDPPLDEIEFGEAVEVPPNMSPFLGYLNPGESLMAIENNMFRAPLFKHAPKHTDFLIIRNCHGYFIRLIPKIYVVGQEHPKIEVPGPNSKVAMRCARERLQSYIFGLFIKSKDVPKRIKIANVRRAFKQHSENSIRKRLKICANYYRQTGLMGKSNWWILKSDFRLPTYEDMHERLQPEMMCSYYSMLAAQRRLKDAGYGKKSLFMAEEENDEDVDSTKNIEEEILCAPWHTTHAFISCQKGKCLMSISGFADPTGCGEGFSYVRQSCKSSREDGGPRGSALDYGSRKVRGFSGLDSDLRKLRLSECRQILHEMGVPFERIERMQRWDMINRIRNLATTSKNINIQEIMGKFFKTSKSIGYDTSENFREACQSIFERQNRVLSSTQEYSSDEEELGDEDSDLEALTKDLESLIQTKDERYAQRQEDEEFSRLDLLRLLEEDRLLFDYEENVNDESHINPTQTSKISKLMIHRKFEEENNEFIRTEVVTDPRIISAYLRITKNPNYRQIYAKHDVKTIEEIRKEKKRVQDQLRRIKKNIENEENEPTPASVVETRKEKFVPKTNVKCTACGEIGHMRTNRICTKYIETHPYRNDQSPSASSDSLESEDDKPVDLPVEKSEKIHIEGTSLIFNKVLIEAAEEISKKSLAAKVPKDMLKRKKRAEDYNCYYYNKQIRNAGSRRRPDPKIYFNDILEEIVLHLKELPECWPFLQPVCPKKVPDYYTIIKTPMNMLTLRDATKAAKYEHRDQFIEDLKLIEHNSILYNGLTHPITHSAKVIVDAGLEELSKKKEELELLELDINPLLSDDPIQKLSWIFENIINSSRSLPYAHPFLCPVNSKTVRDYNLFIQRPMDLETMKINASSHAYLTKQSFINDVELILSNCIQYNGHHHAYTKMAHELHDYMINSLERHSEMIAQCEDQIRGGFAVISSHEPMPQEMQSQQTFDEEVCDYEQFDNVSLVSGEAELLEDLELSEESDNMEDDIVLEL